MKVQVTEKDIKDGWRWSFARLVNTPKPWQIDERHRNCPVALALTRAYKFKVFAETYNIYVRGKKFRTPEVVSDWMQSFDYGFPVTPFEFELVEE
jgi:hypothetical protein